jgi:hypothetical protein
MLVLEKFNIDKSKNNENIFNMLVFYRQKKTEYFNSLQTSLSISRRNLTLAWIQKRKENTFFLSQVREEAEAEEMNRRNVDVDELKSDFDLKQNQAISFIAGTLY